MKFISHSVYLRFIKAVSFCLKPFVFMGSVLHVLAPFGVTALTTWVALNKLNTIAAWFPVPNTRKAFIVLATFLVGAFAAFPAYRQRKTQVRLTEIIRKQYSEYVIAAIEEKLDKHIGHLLQNKPKGQLTMSIMIPHGNHPLKQANTIRIVAASDQIRQLPSVYLQLDWDEGVAGRVWRHGIHASALLVKAPESFEALAINPISRAKKGGNFGHKIGLCLPICSSYKKETKAQFLGVLCVGSNNESDYELFKNFDFIQSLYVFIDSELRDDVSLLLV